MFSFTFISSKRREIANEHIKCEQKTNRKEMEEEKNNERTEPNKAVYLTTVVDTIDTAKFPSERYQMWWKRVKCVQSWFYDLALLAPLDTPKRVQQTTLDGSSLTHPIYALHIQCDHSISILHKCVNVSKINEQKTTIPSFITHHNLLNHPIN